MSVSAWLAGVSDRLHTLWFTALLILGFATASRLLNRKRSSPRRVGERPLKPVALMEPDPDTPIDVQREVEAVLAGLSELISTRQVRLEIAIQPDLVLRTDRRSFSDAVAALVTHAAAQAPSGRVLVTAGRRGGRVQVAVVDDGIGADRTVQAGELRPAESLIALQGGTLEITNVPGVGTTLLARWPEFRGEVREEAAPEVADARASNALRSGATQRALSE